MKKIVCISVLLLNLVACTDRNPQLHDDLYYKNNKELAINFLSTDCQKVQAGEDDNLAKNCRTAQQVMYNEILVCVDQKVCDAIHKNSKLIFRKF